MTNISDYNKYPWKYVIDGKGGIEGWKKIDNLSQDELGKLTHTIHVEAFAGDGFTPETKKRFDYAMALIS